MLKNRNSLIKDGTSRSFISKVLTSNCKPIPRKYLFAHWNGGGTNPPILAIARRLVQRGHNVRILTQPGLQSEVEKIGATFVSVSAHQVSDRAGRETDPKGKIKIRMFDQMRTAAIRLRDRTRIHSRLKTLIAGDGAEMLSYFFGQAPAYAKDVLTELERGPADLVVAMDMLFGAMAAAEKAQLPFVVLAPNICFYPDPGIPPFGSGFLPGKGTFGHLRDTIVRAYHEHTIAKGFIGLNAARQQIGLAPLRHPYEQVERAAKVLVLTSPHFDFAAKSRRANVIYAGPELEDPAWSEPFSEQRARTDERPLVLVGLGTTSQGQAPVLQRILNALGTLPVLGLATTGPALEPSYFDVPENVILRRSLPHSQVLPEASLTITHAGHGTVIRSLAYGVPVLCIPLGRDQRDNAARVVARAVGKRLPSSANTARIRDAIREILRDPNYQNAAQVLGKQIRKEAESSPTVRILEGIANAGRNADCGLRIAE